MVKLLEHGTRLRRRLEILSLCPFNVGALLWEAKPAQWSLTVCVKGTFTLVHGGESVIAPEQSPIDDDRPWEKEPGSSLFSADDLSPLKSRVDVVLSGHAYAPGGSPVTTLTARMRAGDVSKALQITGDRAWVLGDEGLAPGEPAPFVKMPIRYERAALSLDNPVGVGGEEPQVGRLALPNIEAEEGVVAGFGPIAPMWPGRRELIGEGALRWAVGVTSSSRVPIGAAPPSFEFRFFNSAPFDQQLDMVRSGVAIELENLHPTSPLIETKLPAIRPQVFRVDASTGRVVEVALRCDTLFIDSDRGVVMVTWRGLTDVKSGSQDALGRVVVVADPKGKRITPDRIDKMLREDVKLDAATDEEARQNPLEVRHDAVIPRAGIDPTRKLPLPTPQSPTGRFVLTAQDEDQQTLALKLKEAASPARALSSPAAGVPAKPAPSAPAEPAALKPTPAIPAAPKFGAPKFGAPPVTSPALGPQPQPQPQPQAPAAAIPKAPEPAPSKPAAPTPGSIKLASMKLPVAAPAEPSPMDSVGEATRAIPTDEPVAAPTLPFRKDEVEARVLINTPAAPVTAPVTAPTKAPSAPRPPGSLGDSTVRAPLSALKKPATPFEAAKRASPVEPPPFSPPPEPPPLPPPPSQLNDAPPPQQEPPKPAFVAPALVAPNAAPEPSATETLSGAKVIIKSELPFRANTTASPAPPATVVPPVNPVKDEGPRPGAPPAKASRPTSGPSGGGRAASPSVLDRIGVEEYARIVVAIERGDAGRVLTELSLQLSDLMRIQLDWSKKTASDPELNAQAKQAIQAARKKRPG